MPEQEGVVDAAVHAHAAQGVVDVGGVTGQQHPAGPEGLGHPLMHRVDGAVGHLEVAGEVDHAVQEALDVGVGEGLGVALALAHREQGPPHPRGPQQHQPPVGAADVVDVAQAVDVVGQLDGGGDHQVAVLVGHAVEGQPQRLADGAAGPVGGHGEIGAVFGAVGQPDDGAVAEVGGRDDRASELQLDQRIGPEPLGQYLAELELLALQPVGVGGDVGDGGQVESGRHPAPQVPVGEVAGLQPPGDQLADDAQFVEQVEGGRMEGGSPQLQGQFRLGLHQGDRRAPPGQHRGGHAPDRPGPDHDHPRPRHPSGALQDSGRAVRAGPPRLAAAPERSGIRTRAA